MFLASGNLCILVLIHAPDSPAKDIGGKCVENNFVH